MSFIGNLNRYSFHYLPHVNYVSVHKIYANLTINPSKFKIPFIYFYRSLKTQLPKQIITEYFQPTLTGIVCIDCSSLHAFSLVLVPDSLSLLQHVCGPLWCGGTSWGSQLTVLFFPFRLQFDDIMTS